MPMICEPNKYYVCLSYNDDCQAWDLGLDSVSDVPRFYRVVLRLLDERLKDRGLTFYLTWKLDLLPSYGKRVVALVMGDEWSRVPRYSQKVLATFKLYGSGPYLGINRWLPLSRIKMMLGLKYVRSRFLRLPGTLRRMLVSANNRLQSIPQSPIIPIPLGYGNQADLAVRPISERQTDVFFAGSVQHAPLSKSSIRYWLQNPKQLARQAMLEALDKIRATCPEIEIQVAITSSFTLNDVHYGTGNKDEILGIEEYSKAMMDAKICLVPRGTSPETFRLFEALRFGTIPIVEPLPPFSFYKGAPVVEIENWNQLDRVIVELVADRDRMDELHHAALAWWKSHCCEEVIADTIAQTINSLRPVHT